MSGANKRRTSSPGPCLPAPESGASCGGTVSGSSRSSDNIQVFVRLRPLSQAEHQKGQVVAWGTDGAGGVGPLQRGALAVKFVYDRVFEDAADNSQVFEAVARPLLGPVLGGTSATVLAYGVTSSGKTHTMMGRMAPPSAAAAAAAAAEDNSISSAAGMDTGLVQRCLAELFAAFQLASDRQYSATMSVMEVYCEQLNDLLDPSKVNLEVAEVPVKGSTPGLTSLFIKGLTEVKVGSLQAALDLFRKGQDSRKVGSTAFNDQSSRSHTLCRLHITSCPVDSAAAGGAAGGSGGAITTTSAYLTLADLAGSEGASATTNKDQRLEAANINRSLLTLGKVIWELGRAKGSAGGTGEGGAGEALGAHVPFRDSLLTRLLKPSLTGLGARAALVCCIAPGSGQSEETRNTLLFADGAKRIRVVASKQEAVDWPLLVRRLQGELAAAQQQLAALGGASGGVLPSNSSTSLCCPSGLAVADADYQQLQLTLQLAQEQRDLLLAERNALSSLNQQLMALALIGAPESLAAAGATEQEQHVDASRNSTEGMLHQQQQEQQAAASTSSRGVASRGSGLRRALSAESISGYAYWIALRRTVPGSQTSHATAALDAAAAAVDASSNSQQAGEAQRQQQQQQQQQQSALHQQGLASVGHHPARCLSATSSFGGVSLGHGLLRLSDESDLAGGGPLELPPDLLPDSTRSSWGGHHQQTQQQDSALGGAVDTVTAAATSQQLPGVVEGSPPVFNHMRRSLSLDGVGEGEALVDFSCADDPDDLLLSAAPGLATLHAICGTAQRRQRLPDDSSKGGPTQAEPSSSLGFPLSLHLQRQLLRPQCHLTAAWASVAVLQQRVEVLQQQVVLQGALLQQQRAWERETDMELRLAVVAADRALLREELAQVQQQLATSHQQLAAARAAAAASPVHTGVTSQRSTLSRSSSSCCVRDGAIAGGSIQPPTWSRSSTPDMCPDKPSSIPLPQLSPSPQLGAEPSSSSLTTQPSFSGNVGTTSSSRRGSCSGHRAGSSSAVLGRGEGQHGQSGMPPRPVPPGGLSPRGLATEGGGVDVKVQSRIPSPVIMMGSSGAQRPPSGGLHRQ